MRSSRKLLVALTLLLAGGLIGNASAAPNHTARHGFHTYYAWGWHNGHYHRHRHYRRHHHHHCRLVRRCWHDHYGHHRCRHVRVCN